MIMNIIPENIKTFFKYICVTLCGISLVVFGVSAMVSILSYSSSDISINTSSNINSNFFQNYGSYTAEFVLQFFRLDGLFVLL